jgi:spore maturation protein CgeB
LRILLFYHSLISDWNHGNAHFLRGVASELLSRGHEVTVYEPVDAWSLSNLISDHGEEPIANFRRYYPTLRSVRYDLGNLDIDRTLTGADLVIVHEWNDHDLVARIGDHHMRVGSYRLLFHDTHHRSVTDPDAMAAYDLGGYDGVLAFGGVIRDIYLDRGWSKRAWTWHEAADSRLFRPEFNANGNDGDLVWVGNWGDDERSQELTEFLLNPVNKSGLSARVYGVRYPETALAALAAAGVEYAGWLPNYEVPRVFSKYRVTAHVPRRPYTQALPGIPTIRVFEALACGIPLVSAPWDDVEGLFTPGEDFLVAHDGAEMEAHLRFLLEDGNAARKLAEHGRSTVLARHTCAHRVDELLDIYAGLEGSAS